MQMLKVVRPFKRGENFAAVYKFTFDNGYFYIGGTKKIATRISKHREKIKNGNHTENVLKASIDCRTITFEILERVKDISVLGEREDYYLRLNWGDPLLLNRAESHKGGFKRTDQERHKHRLGRIRSGNSEKRNAAVKAAMKKKAIEHPEMFKRIGEVNYKRVAAFKNGEFIQEFESLACAEKFYNIVRGDVSKVANGVLKTAKGYSFKYVSEDGQFIEPKTFTSFGPSAGQPVPIAVMNMEGRLLLETRTIKEAAEITGANQAAIYKVCIGKRKSSNGFTFKRI